jgi:hypothetical protein
MKEIVLYPSFALTAILGFITGGGFYSQSSHNDTLKLCNQKPLECKFKYDILMYNETGRVPYTTPKPVVTKENEKK